MGEHLHGGIPRRVLLLLAVCGVAVLSAAGIASAGGSASQAAPNATTLVTKLQNGQLKFAPRNVQIAEGGRLNIVNRNPGIPHTVTLVRGSLLPQTRTQRRQCYNPGRICFTGLAWHRAVDNNQRNDLDRVEVGQPGFDREGTLNREGDSIFFNRRPRSVVVSAASGRTLNFLCLIHPFMQGKINVE